MREQEKLEVYLARARSAEEQAATAGNVAERLAWTRVANEYREAAKEALKQQRA